MTPTAKALADRLDRMAAECESTEDAETGELATFVPGVVSGFFHDYLTDAAAKLRKADRLLAAADALAEAGKEYDEAYASWLDGAPNGVGEIDTRSVSDPPYLRLDRASSRRAAALTAYQEARDGK